MSDWSDRPNAEYYDAFAREYDTYRDASRDLVGLVDLPSARVVVDLACGTGVTTEAILGRIAPTAEVIAVDASESMLAVAQRNVEDPRVTWLCRRAADLNVAPKPADAIVCNSAMWQLDIEPTLTAAARTLRPGGRIAFNIPSAFLNLLVSRRVTKKEAPSLHDLVREIATHEHNHIQTSRPTTRRTPLTLDTVFKALVTAGFQVREMRRFTYETPLEGLIAWLRIPVFADNLLYGMPHEEQLEVIAKAAARVDLSQGSSTEWIAFVADRDADH